MVESDDLIFGGYNWRVLAKIDNRALVITSEIIELRWYHHEFTDITWADSEIRKYLNTSF